MHFLIDAQLPPALARWIADCGYEAAHVADLGMATAEDPVIWDWALASGAVIITKDEDFARRRALVQSGPAVLWLRIGNCRRRELLHWFSTMFSQVLLLLQRGDLLVEMRGLGTDR